MKARQLLVVNILAAIFGFIFVLGDPRPFIIITSLAVSSLTATCSFCLVSVTPPKHGRVTLPEMLQRILVLVPISALAFALPVILIALGASVLGSHTSYKIETLGEFTGAALVGSIAGALSGVLVTWGREVAVDENIVHLVRNLDQRAGAVGASLALAFSLGPTGNDKLGPVGIVLGVFTGMLTAAITSRLTRAFGGSLASAFKSAMTATVSSTFAFLFGTYLAILGGPTTGTDHDRRSALLLLGDGFGTVMASSPIPSALSHAIPVLGNGAILLIASIGAIAACSITSVAVTARAATLTLMLVLIYTALGGILGTLAFPMLDTTNFEGAIAGGLAGMLAGACVGLEGDAFKDVTAGLIGGCLAAVLGNAIASQSLSALNRVVGGALGGLDSVKGQLNPGVLGAVFGGVLGGLFPETLTKAIGEVWGQICVGILSGVLAFMLILATEITLMGVLSAALRAVTMF